MADDHADPPQSNAGNAPEGTGRLAVSDEGKVPPSGTDSKGGSETSGVPRNETPPRHVWRGRALLLVVILGVAGGIWYLAPAIRTALDTVSTDDAYVNGHVTFLAPRVSGQVSRVLVDDNMRVKNGDILVQLDKEPYQVQLAIRRAAVVAAESDVNAAQARVRALIGQARANRFQLQHAIEDVNSKIADLKALVAKLESAKATLALAEANRKRGEELLPSGGISKEDLDIRRQTVKVNQASVDQALQDVYAARVGLGLPTEPLPGRPLSETPPDLVETFSSVRQALGQLMETAAQLGYSSTNWEATPREAIDEFYRQDPQGDLGRIYAKLIPQAPAIKQAEAKLMQAQRELAQAELNLRYCDVVSEIDGVVTRRNVNPGNNVQVGQNLMAVRSLTEIWIDANFKETQLADLRIGQRVRCEVDMYGKKYEFEGRITGFTMGTGQTLSLLPPQNATGNFVKIVQRLPVRIELTDYHPDKQTLFVGLSVVPYVYYKEKAEGPHAGEFLQPPLTGLPRGQVSPTVQPVAPAIQPATGASRR
jgi:membrane fusion protein (multidrug efflux system)